MFTSKRKKKREREKEWSTAWAQRQRHLTLLKIQLIEAVVMEKFRCKTYGADRRNVQTFLLFLAKFNQESVGKVEKQNHKPQLFRTQTRRKLGADGEHPVHIIECTSRPGERNESWKLHWIDCHVEDKPDSQDWYDKPVSGEILVSLNKYNCVPLMCFTEALRCHKLNKTQLETVSQRLHANLGRNNPLCGVSCSINSLVAKNVREGSRQWRQIGRYFSDKGYLKRKLKKMEFKNQIFFFFFYLFFFPFCKEAPG